MRRADRGAVSQSSNDKGGDGEADRIDRLFHDLHRMTVRNCGGHIGGGPSVHEDGRGAGIEPGGMQRVLSIATALAAGPRLLLLDEPLAGLNATEKAEVATRIERLRDDGITVLLVEHDIKSVLRLCNSITVINFGARIASGSPGEIARDETVIKAYLGERGVRHAAN